MLYIIIEPQDGANNQEREETTMTKEYQYQGQVQDRLGEMDYHTGWYSTWEQAHRAAVRLLRRKHGRDNDRWQIEVVDR